MYKDSIEHMNKMEIALAHSQMSRLAWLRQLLCVESIKNGELGKVIVEAIRHFISKITEYTIYSGISHLKGVFSRKTDAERVSDDHYSYENTPQGMDEEDKLFALLDMDRNYLNPEIIKQYEGLERCFSKDELHDIELSRKNTFVIGESEYTVLFGEDKDRYEAFVEEYKESYAKEHGGEVPSIPECRIDKDVICVPSDTDIYRDFVGQGIEIPTPGISKDFIKEDGSQIIQVAIEKAGNADRKAIPAYDFKIPKEPGFIKIRSKDEIKLQNTLQAMAIAEPDSLKKLEVGVTFKSSRIVRDDPDTYFVRLPKSKDEENRRYHDLVVGIPKSLVNQKHVREDGFLVNLPMNFAPSLYTADMSPIYGFNDNGSPILTATDDRPGQLVGSMSEIVTTLDIKGLTVKGDERDISRNGEKLKLFEFGGFKFGLDDKRAVLISYSEEQKDVKIPPGLRYKGKNIPVTEIASNAFAGRDVNHVVIPGNVQIIRQDAFNGCKMSSVLLSEGIKTIETGAFANCFNLERINFPSSVEEVGAKPLSGCQSLSQITAAEGGLLSVVDGMLIARGEVVVDYASATDFSDVHVPDGIKKIADRAFELSGQIESVSLPESLTDIGSSAFEECRMLKTVTLTSQVNIYDHAFANSPVESIDTTLMNLKGRDVLSGTAVFDHGYQDKPEVFPESLLSSEPDIRTASEGKYSDEELSVQYGDLLLKQAQSKESLTMYLDMLNGAPDDEAFALEGVVAQAQAEYDYISDKVKDFELIYKDREIKPAHEHDQRKALDLAPGMSL